MTETMTKIAVITGASAGLGQAFARYIDQHPAFAAVEEIWLVARRRDHLAAVAASLPSQRGVVVVADLTTAAGLATVRDRVSSRSAEVLLLVNNAGCGILGPFSDHSSAEIGRIIDLNIRAATCLLQQLGSAMPRGALVLQLASAAAYVPAPYFAVYAASKSYMLALSLAVREEWRARGVSVCAVCPGPVATEFFVTAGSASEVAGMAAEQVVAIAVRDGLAGRAVSHASASAGALAWASRVLPRALLVRLAARRNLRRGPPPRQA